MHAGDLVQPHTKQYDGNAQTCRRQRGLHSGVARADHRDIKASGLIRNHSISPACLIAGIICRRRILKTARPPPLRSPVCGQLQQRPQRLLQKHGQRIEGNALPGRLQRLPQGWADRSRQSLCRSCATSMASGLSSPSPTARRMASRSCEIPCPLLADSKDIRELPADVIDVRRLWQIRFVDHSKGRARRGLPDQLLVLIGEPVGTVEITSAKSHWASLFRARSTPIAPRGFALPQACGIGKPHPHTGQLKLPLNHIPGGAGDLGHDATLLRQKQVHQRGFPHIGPPTMAMSMPRRISRPAAYPESSASIRDSSFCVSSINQPESTGSISSSG